MTCESCKERDAVVELKQVVASGVKQTWLCEKCAAERGIPAALPAASNPLGDFLQTVQQQLSTTRSDAAVCPFCSLSMRDFKSTGRLGCASCYAAFEGSLRELLRRVHGNSRHLGRAYVPPLPDPSDRAGTLLELRDRLRRAIVAEQFEVAADLRDRIRVLE